MTTRVVALACAVFTLGGCAATQRPTTNTLEATMAPAPSPDANTASDAIISLPASGTTTTDTGASPATAPRDGWWIKIRKERQESPTISFSIGSSNDNVEAWKTWHSPEPLELAVPEKYRHANPLYIKAQSSNGRNSWFCMMYGLSGVKHFDFDDHEDHEEQQSNRDDECSFGN